MAQKKTAPDKDRAPKLSDRVWNAGRDTYFAGLGAVAMIGDESGKLFDRLVQRGAKVEKDEKTRYRRTVDGTTRKVRQLTDRVENGVREATSGMLHRAGVPTGDEIRDLIERVDQLTGKVEALNAAK
jgi:poly(hydroxyalkanoate) granule-associated protein